MNRPENRSPLTGRLMIGPDGAVYDLRTGTPQESPDDLSSAVSPRLSQHSSDGGVGGGCFAYSAEAPRQAPGQGSPCFRFSAEALAGPRGD
jgi:hypothetical protein